jgi:hypothetical protein
MKTIRTKRPADLFKPLQRRDQLCAVYLYADGHATASFERRIPDADQSIQYYKQIDSLGIACRFAGRLVFSRYGGQSWIRAMLAVGCSAIDVARASIDYGTELTKAKGIPVGHISASTPFGTIYVYEYPTLMSADYTYQPDIVEAFDPNLETFGHRQAIAETLITKPEGTVATIRSDINGSA